MKKLGVLMAGTVLAVGFVPVMAFAADGQAAATAPAPQAAAGSDDQAGGKSGSGLSEIVVTASKRSQNIQSVGVAVTALNAEKLAAIGTSDVTSIVQLVPSLQSYVFAPTITVFNIRGVSQNDYTDHQEAPIAFYSDGVYISSPGAIAGQMFDVAQIEVLRGPQGTLFGRNATGGVIQVDNAKPTKDLSGYLKLSGGSYGEYASEGAIGGPLANGVRGRLSFYTDNHDGYVTNLFNNTKLGNANTWGIRGQLDFDVPGGDLLIKGYYSRNAHEVQADYKAIPSVQNALGLGVLTPNPNNPNGYWDAYGPYTVSINQQPHFDRTYSDISATYNAKFGDIQLVSITDYQHLHKDYAEDSDSIAQDIYWFASNQNLYQASEELRISENKGRLKWVVGAYGLIIHSVAQQYNNFDGLVPPQNTAEQDTLKSRSIAVFGQAEYSFGDFVAIGGLRGSFDRKNYDYFLHQVTAGIGNSPPVHDDIYYNASTAPTAIQYSNSWSGKAEIDYKPNNRTLLYFSVNRGTKAGGFAAPGANGVSDAQFIQEMPFGQEILTNFEAGWKLTVLDNTTRVNGALFHYTYNGYQTYSYTNFQGHISNNEAHVNGGELEVTTAPIRNLNINAFVSYLDGTVYGILVPSGDSLARQLPQAPKWSGGGSISLKVPTKIGVFTASTDWKNSGSFYWEAFNAPADRENGYWLGNANVNFVPAFEPRVTLGVSVKNVTNRAYHVYGYDLSGLGYEQYTMGRPRWVLASLTYKLGR